MAKFIPINQITKLKEDSKNGDERAKNILSMYLDGKDFSTLIEEYFAKPKTDVVEKQATQIEEKEQSGLEKFLSFNNITKENPDYKEYVLEYYNENPQERDENILKEMSEIGEEKVNQELSNIAVSNDGQEECSTLVTLIKNLIEDENEAIQGYDKGILFVANSEKDRNILNVLNEIKTDEIRHIKMLKELVE